MVTRIAERSWAGRRRILMFLLATVVLLVLLFSYRTSRGPDGATAAGTAGDNRAGIVSQPGGSRTSGGSAAPDSTIVNGTVEHTRWGPVQVQVTITGGKITDVQAIRYPQGNSRDQEINVYALPRLRTEVLRAQSADIDAVSGATVTSDGYIDSLRAALDMANFG